MLISRTSCFSVPNYSLNTSSMMMFLFFIRAYAEAGSSVQHSEQRDREEEDFVSESEEEKSVESSNDEAKEDGGEGKKKKPRSGFRDRKVINKRRTFSQVHCIIQLLNVVWKAIPINVRYAQTSIFLTDYFTGVLRGNKRAQLPSWA